MSPLWLLLLVPSACIFVYVGTIVLWKAITGDLERFLGDR